MLGRYMRLYVFGSDRKTLNKWVAVAGYLVCAGLLALMAFLVFRGGFSYVVSRCVFSYLNPLTIMATVFLFLFFRDLKIDSGFVNTVAKSSFAVYLFHLNPFIWDKYLSLCRDISSRDGMFAPLLIAGLIIVVFALGILTDQIRIRLWKMIDRHFPEHSNKV